MTLFSPHTAFMMLLAQSINAWGYTDFESIFKAEVSQLDHASLPLQQGLSQSSYVSEDPFSLVVLNSYEDDLSIKVKTGIFYSGIIAGCSCADDPTPPDTQNEYCEVLFCLNKSTGESKAELIED